MELHHPVVIINSFLQLLFRLFSMHYPRNTASALEKWMSILFFGGLMLVGAVLLGNWRGGQLFGGTAGQSQCEAPCVPGSESIMSPKEHGTSHTVRYVLDIRFVLCALSTWSLTLLVLAIYLPLTKKAVQSNLRWGCDWDKADQICNYNRHYAEFSGYWKTTSFLTNTDTRTSSFRQTFYDSNTGKPLFYAPIDRTWDEWIAESSKHGWPSFRDSEVNWDNVRVLPNGETVSVDGTHLVSRIVTVSFLAALVRLICDCLFFLHCFLGSLFHLYI
jgi:hypothetical protein